MILIDFLVDWAECHISDLLHSFPNFISLLIPNHATQIPKWKLIAIFKLAVTRWVLLNGIVCQMDKIIVNVLHLEGLRRCPHITLLKEVKSKVLG
jgi:hypothetical protein